MQCWVAIRFHTVGWNVFPCSRGHKKNVLEPYMNAIEIDMHHEGVIWVMWSWGAIVPASHSSQEVSPGKLWWVPSGQATQILVSAASWQKHAKTQCIQKTSKKFMVFFKKTGLIHCSWMSWHVWYIYPKVTYAGMENKLSHCYSSFQNCDSILQILHLLFWHFGVHCSNSSYNLLEVTQKIPML